MSIRRSSQVAKPFALDFAWALKSEKPASLSNLVEGCIIDALVAVEHGNFLWISENVENGMISSWNYSYFLPVTHWNLNERAQSVVI